jgi:hypothetical protein
MPGLLVRVLGQPSASAARRSSTSDGPASRGPGKAKTKLKTGKNSKADLDLISMAPNSREARLTPYWTCQAKLILTGIREPHTLHDRLG